MHGSWLNVGPSCCILVPIHNVSFFLAFYTTNPNPTSHSISQREIFYPLVTKYGPDNAMKPVLVITVEGGPDENPRYQKVIEMAVHHLVQHILDAYFIATNAPGRSAFNRVERRMAPLSQV